MLGQVLRPLNEMFLPKDYPSLLVGLAAPDDAAVYKLNDEQAIISTLDFFPPVVDDPYTFGAIAAANALSDVYAMGGEVLFALNLAAWRDDLDPNHLTQILRGGAEKVKEAGGVIAGGHTITDKEPKYGLAVTGMGHPQRLFTKGGARVGDVLLLTKPLGTGVLTTALKRGLAQLSEVQACVASMSQLNKEAARAAMAVQSGVHAVTDVTGFGLLGHAHEMAHLSQLTFKFNFAALPWLAGTHTHAAQWVFPGGSERNEEFYSQWVKYEVPLELWQQRLLHDPQTSGGLLMALTPAAAQVVSQQLATWQIGEVCAGGAGDLVIV